MHSKNQKRHGSPCPSRAPLVPMKPKVSVASGLGDTLAFRVPRDYPHSRFSKAPLAVYPPKGARGKACVSLPVVSLEKMSCLGRAEGGAHIRVSCPSSSSAPSSSSSSSPSSVKPSPAPPAPPHRPQEKLANGRGPRTPRPGASPSSSLDGRPSPARSPLRSPLDKRPSSTPSPSPLDPRPSAAPPSPLDKKPQNGSKTARPHKRLSGRVFDPNKHCGVQDPESKRQCTRSLTCKTHSLTHRRAVPGRRNQFDILLAEHKGRAKEKDATKEREKEGVGGQGRREAQGAVQSQTAPPQGTPAPGKPSPHLHNGRTVSTLKLRLANAHIPRVPGGGGGGAAAVSSSAPAAAPAPPASSSDAGASWVRVGDGSSRMSSDEGGEAELHDDPDGPAASPRHPRPLGVCGFSSRLMGRGLYVFDRRWDRMRLALHYMVEKHVNAQMWRKVPLAVESLLSSPGPHAGPHPPSPSPSGLAPPLLSSPSSVPLSCSEAFSLPSYSAAFPQSAAGAGLFCVRDPSLAPPASAPGGPRGGTARPGRPPREEGGGDLGRAKKRKTSSSFLTLAGAVDDGHQRNGSSYHAAPADAAPPLFPGAGGRKKALGRGGGGSGLAARGEDWYPSPDPAVPYPHSRDPALPPASSSLPPPPATSPLLAYRGGAQARRRRSPGKTSSSAAARGLEGIFRRGGGGLLASGPGSPPQPKTHH